MVVCWSSVRTREEDALKEILCRVFGHAWRLYSLSVDNAEQTATISRRCTRCGKMRYTQCTGRLHGDNVTISLDGKEQAVKEAWR
jgi:hypothetical protein